MSDQRSGPDAPRPRHQGAQGFGFRGSEAAADAEARARAASVPRRPLSAVAVVSGGALACGPAAIREALAALRADGWEVTEAVAETRWRAADLASLALDEGRDAVVAVGGDGTLGAVAGALRHSDALLVPLPAGTANGWAREMGIPPDPRRAARRLVAGSRVVRVDVGTVRTGDGEYGFLATAGVGYDALVAHETPSLLKRWLGVGAYALTVVWTWPGYHGGLVGLSAEGVHLRTRALLVAIGNTRTYGGIVTVLPSADNTDGLLDVCVFGGRSWLDKLAHTVRVLLGRHTRAPSVTCRQLPRFEVDGAPPLPIQADGDYVGTTPATFACHRQAVRVLLPA